MKRLWEKPGVRRALCIIGVCAGVILAVFYFRYVFTEGIYYNNIFLMRSGGETVVYEGTVNDLPMELVRQVDASIDVLVTYRYDDIEKVYKVHGDLEMAYELIVTCDGEVVYRGGQAPDISIVGDGSEAQPDSKLPGMWLVIQVARDEPDFRGSPVWGALSLIIMVIVLIDIRWPDLYFDLRYWMTVVDPEPTDFYRACQKAGRVIALVAVVILLFRSLWP